MERLGFEQGDYMAIEGSIHMNRYLMAKSLCKGKRVLDIACGEGYGSFLLSQWGAKEVVGYDISKSAIEKANANFQLDNIKFIAGNAENLADLSDSAFDLIVSFETIEHIAEPTLFLKEIKRVATEKAAFIISCPNDYFYYPETNQSNPYHIKKYTFDDFKKLTESLLGKNAEYFIGTYLNGYLNIKHKKNDLKKVRDSQKNMLDYEEINSILIPADTEVTNKNCCYYTGVWNAKISDTATVYPYSYNEIMSEMIKINSQNIKINQTNISILEELEISKAEILKFNLLFEQKDDLLKETNNKIRKYKSILESTEKENEFVKSNIREICANYDEINNRFNLILGSRTYKLAERARLLIRKFIK